jgi:DNA-binding transcriptional ArsR family regulator
VTKHLDTLYDAGLVETERRGRERIVTFRPEPLREATDWVATIEARWDRRLAALANFLAIEAAEAQPSTELPSEGDPS